MAHHIEVQRLQKLIYVDPAGIGRKPARMTGRTGYLPYQGRSPDYGLIKEKSAEVIVAGSNEPSRTGRSHDPVKPARMTGRTGTER